MARKSVALKKQDKRVRLLTASEIDAMLTDVKVGTAPAHIFNPADRKIVREADLIITTTGLLLKSRFELVICRIATRAGIAIAIKKVRPNFRGSRYVDDSL